MVSTGLQESSELLSIHSFILHNYARHYAERWDTVGNKTDKMFCPSLVAQTVGDLPAVQET